MQQTKKDDGDRMQPLIETPARRRCRRVLGVPQ